MLLYGRSSSWFFLQKPIPFYSPHSCESIALIFVEKRPIFIEIYSIYYASIQYYLFSETILTLPQTRNPYPSKPVPVGAGAGKLGLGYG
jgi:hypothetical protein